MAAALDPMYAIVRPDASMSRLTFALFLFILTLVQATLLPRVNPLPITPDLVMIAIVFWTARHSMRESLMWIFVVGMVLDVLAMDPLGAHALAYAPIAALAWPLTSRPWRFDLYSASALVATASLVCCPLLAILRGSGLGILNAYQVVMHIVLAPFVFFVYRFVARR